MKELSSIVLEMLASLNSVSKSKDRLIEIAADGVISDDEIDDFIYIQNELERISITVETLQLWSEKMLATVYKGNIIKNLIMDCQSYTKYRPNETTGGIFVSWRRKEELPTGA